MIDENKDDEWLAAIDEEDTEKDVQVEDDEQEEEIIMPKHMGDPGEPAKKEREEREVLHLPYRPWCKWCVLGKGQSDHHVTEKKDVADVTVPTISIDYMFLGTKNVKAKDRTVLAIFDNRTKAVMALMTHSKGPVEWVMNAAVKFIDELGYGKIAISIKCDGEPAIMAVRDAISKKRAAPTIPLDAPVREAQSNGGMERAVKTIQGQYRTLLSHLVDRVGIDVKDNFDVLQWLAHWISHTLNKYKVHSHGKTSYHMAPGHMCKRPVATFGEKVLAKKSAKPGTRKDKGESEFQEGIYLCVVGRGIESIIGTPHGLISEYTVRRMPESQRWSMDDISEIQCPMPNSRFGPQEEEMNVQNSDVPGLPGDQECAPNVTDETNNDFQTEEPSAPPDNASGDNAMGYSPTSPAE